MDIIQLYGSILRYAGLDADADGFVYTVLEDRREPALIEGVRLVLPTAAHLKTPNPTEKLIFHPLSENILRGESEVIKKLKDVINIRLNFTFGIIGQSLLNLIASPELHHKLDPDQSELLIGVKDVDDTTLKNFISVMVAGVKERADRMFLNIYLKRGGSIGGKRFSRAGIVTFPMYEELAKEGNEIYGIKVRVKDKEAFKQLYQFMFSKVDDPLHYSMGSDANMAPYLDSLMRTSMSLAGRLNDILIQYADYIDEGDRLMFDADWVADFENLDNLTQEIRRIPPQVGNEGKPKAEDQLAQQPIQQPIQPAPLPVPQVIPQTGYPIPGYTPTGYAPQQPYVPPKPELKVTKRGIDFASLKQTNPGLAFAPNPLAPQLFQQQQQVMQQRQPPEPSWARPTVPMGPVYGNPGYNQPVVVYGQPVQQFQQSQQFQQPMGNNPMYPTNYGNVQV